jgi:hypothetical protein
MLAGFFVLIHAEVRAPIDRALDALGHDALVYAPVPANQQI